MIKRNILLLFAFLLAHEVCCQKQGVYQSSLNEFEKLTVDSPYILIWSDAPDCGMAFYYSDTIAKMYYYRESMHFINVSSCVSTDMVEHSAVIARGYDANLRDSIRIIFYLPNIKNPLRIGIQLNNQETNLSYDADRGVLPITLPKIDGDNFLQNITIHSTRDVGLCVRGYRVSPTHISIVNDMTIDSITNIITVSVPLLTDYFFGQYQLQHEYMRVSNDTITWRGMYYIKQR